jgi:uncharacterized membrane protein
MEWKKGLISGIIAGVVLTVIGFAFMMIPGTSEWYSTTFPQMAAPEAMWAMTLSIFLVGLFMGLVYSVINSAVPGEGARKGVNYGIMVWLFAGVMWPVMMMGFAPAYIWIIELITGLINYSITGVVIAIVYKKL